ncbi:MAG TPA: class I SAM-dependent methyltransferase, partial [Thermoanaerobaculia bacterium]
SYYAQILAFYELEAAGKSDLAFWRRLCHRSRPRRVLEIGSGLGRVTRALADESPSVAGIDVSMEMLAIARKAGFELAAADMRRLPFVSDFDLVVAPNDPFSHLTSDADRLRALESVARALRPGGRFVLDGLYFPSRRPVVRHRRIPVFLGALTIRESWEPLEGRDLWKARYVYCLQTGAEVREKSAAFVAKSWDPRRLGPLFESAGLRLERLRGGLADEPVTAASRRVLATARTADPVC